MTLHGHPPVDRVSARLLLEVVAVFESHDSPNSELLAFLLEDANSDLKAYAIGLLPRWYDRFSAGTQAGIPLKDAVIGTGMASGGRKSVASWVAAASNPSRDALILYGALSGESKSLERESDKFVALAKRAAVGQMRQFIEKTTAGIPESEVRERLAALLRPPAGKDSSHGVHKGHGVGEKPASSNSVDSVNSVRNPVAATGQLRATPEFVAALVKEVRASGDAKRGAEVFRRAELTCTVCHSLDDKGGKIGPPLDTIGSGQPLDFIIGATLEPQREIKESYEAMQMTAKDGRVATGYIAQRTAEGTTLRDAATGAETRFAAAEIAEFRPIGSLMPAGLVDRLSREDLRDLFRYLSELGKPR